MKKCMPALVTLMVVAMVIVSCAIPVKKRPAEFKVTNLTITPSQVKSGEPVTVSIKVANVGEESGTTSVKLLLQGKTEESKTITLPGGEEETVSFKVRREEPGDYPVEIAGLSGSFKVQISPNTIKVGKVQISVGKEASLPINLLNAKKGLSGYDFTVSLSKEEIAEITGVEFPKLGLTESSNELPAASVKLRAVDLQGTISPGAEKALLATIKVRGKEAGVTKVELSIRAMDDDEGNRIKSEVIEGRVEVGGS